MTHLRVVTHYQATDSLSRLTPRKNFAYALLGIRIPVPHRYRQYLPIANWIAPHVLGPVPVGRRVIKLDMSAPIPDSKNEIPMAGETFYPPGSPERCVHKSPKLSPAERKKADKKYYARRGDTGYDW